MELLGVCVSCDSNCLTLLLGCSFLPIETGGDEALQIICPLYF